MTLSIGWKAGETHTVPTDPAHKRRLRLKKLAASARSARRQPGADAPHDACKKVYRSIDELQADLDAWIKEYNEARPHQGRWCFGKTPMQTFLDAMPMTKEKMIAA
jgi:Integrase core domain